jgi:cytochrome c-type biogenesis protein CcmH/NrfF
MTRSRSIAQRVFRRVAAIGALLALLLPSVASAACPRTSLASIEDTVMCQVCGVPLGLATESPEATRERAFISNLVDRCDTANEIRAALVAQYGPSVLALPPTRGFELAAYLIPMLGVLAAGALVAMVALGWRSRHHTREPSLPSTLDAADDARVQAALERLRD